MSIVGTKIHERAHFESNEIYWNQQYNAFEWNIEEFSVSFIILKLESIQDSQNYEVSCSALVMGKCAFMLYEIVQTSTEFNIHILCVLSVGCACLGTDKQHKETQTSLQ